jgi:hypothetical protein
MKKQMNVRLEDADFDAIEAMRAAMRPIPTAAEIVRDAIREKFARMQRKGAGHADR